MQSPRAKGPLYDPWALSKKLGAEFIGVFLFASVWSFKNQMLSSATAQAVPAGFVLGVTLAVSGATARAPLHPLVVSDRREDEPGSPLHCLRLPAAELGTWERRQGS